MRSGADTVEDYLAALPDDRRATVEGVLAIVRDNLPAGYAEGMQYGMIGWSVPLERYPPGYHAGKGGPLPFAALASQKNHVSLYLMGLYCGCGTGADELTPDARWFRDAWEATGKKLDMGKSCVRFKRLEDVPLEVVAEAIRRVPVERYVAAYEATRSR